VNKPSLLLISAASIIAENRKRLSTLAESFDLTCVTCNAARSLGVEVRLRVDEQPPGYGLISLPTFGRGECTTRSIFRGLKKVFASRRFDMVLVEVEPWGLVRWQAWLWKSVHQRRALFGEFSWENAQRLGLKGWILRLIYRLAARTGDFAIAGNRGARQLLTQRGLPPDRVLVAPQFGVDELLFCPIDKKARTVARNREDISPGVFLIGFCGRFLPEKGVMELVQAAEAVRVAHPSRNIELALLGSGSLDAELRRMARQQPWLRVLPPRPHPEVAGFMALLDLFILPSKPHRADGKVWEEQFGHVLIEAMSCGVACIGSSSGAIPEVLGDQMLTFPPGDIHAIVDGISRAVDNPELGTRMRERVLARFTNRTVAEQWATFLLDRLKERPSRGSR